MSANSVQPVWVEVWQSSQTAINRSHMNKFATISFFSGVAAGYMLIKFTATPLVLLGVGCLAVVATAALVKAYIARTHYLRGRVEAEERLRVERERIEKAKTEMETNILGPMSYAALKAKHGAYFLTFFNEHFAANIACRRELTTKFYCHALDQGWDYTQLSATADYQQLGMYRTDELFTCYQALSAALRNKSYVLLLQQFGKNIFIRINNSELKYAYDLRVKSLMASSSHQHILTRKDVHLHNLGWYFSEELDLFDAAFKTELRKAIVERDLQLTFQEFSRNYQFFTSSWVDYLGKLLREFPHAKDILRNKCLAAIREDISCFAQSYKHSILQKHLGITDKEFDSVRDAHLEKFQKATTLTEITPYRELIENRRRSRDFGFNDLPHTRRLILKTFNDERAIRVLLTKGSQWDYQWSNNSQYAWEINFIRDDKLLPEDLKTSIDFYHQKKYKPIEKTRDEAVQKTEAARLKACDEALKTHQAAQEKIAIINKEVGYDAKKHAKLEGEKKLRDATNALSHLQTELARAQDRLTQNQGNRSILVQKVSETEKIDVSAVSKEASDLESTIAKLEADLKAAIDSPDINSQVDLDLEKVFGNPDDDDNLSITMPSMSFVNAAEQPIREKIAHYQSQLAPLQAKLKQCQELEQTRKELESITNTVRSDEKTVMEWRWKVEDAQTTKDKAASGCDDATKAFNAIASLVEGPTAVAQGLYDEACKQAAKIKKDEDTEINKILEKELTTLVREFREFIQKEQNAN